MCDLVAAFSKNPILSLIGCAVCGFSVGIMWPGVLSLAAGFFPKAGTALFAILALAGDMGCSSGPWIVGQISDYAVNIYEKSAFLQRFGFGQLETGIKTGLFFVTVFPIAMIAIILAVKKVLRKKLKNI